MLKLLRDNECGGIEVIAEEELVELCDCAEDKDVVLAAAAGCC